MEKVKRVLVLGESQVGKTWFVQQMFRDINQSRKIADSQRRLIIEASSSSPAGISNLFNSDTPSEQQIEPFQSEKTLKSQVGCHVHVHLINSCYRLDPHANTFYYVECYELSGQISPSMLLTYVQQKSFDGLIVAFDLSNQKTLVGLHQLILTGLQLVQQSQDSTRFGHSPSKVDFEDGSLDILARCPVLVVGCKKDLLEANKSLQLKVNGQVQDCLKKVDRERQIEYIEVGLSQHRSVYRVPQDEMIGYIGRLFNDALPIVEDSDLTNLLDLSQSSISESSDTEQTRVKTGQRQTDKSLFGSLGTAFSQFIKNGGLPQ